jgi:hypothetical protein
MRVKAHLTAANGMVACPSTGQLEDLGHCAQCIDLETIEGQDESRQVVVCKPEVDSFGAALDRILRARA